MKKEESIKSIIQDSTRIKEILKSEALKVFCGYSMINYKNAFVDSKEDLETKIDELASLYSNPPLVSNSDDLLKLVEDKLIEYIEYLLDKGGKSYRQLRRILTEKSSESLLRVAVNELMVDGFDKTFSYSWYTTKKYKKQAEKLIRDVKRNDNIKSIILDPNHIHDFLETVAWNVVNSKKSHHDNISKSGLDFLVKKLVSRYCNPPIAYSNEELVELIVETLARKMELYSDNMSSRYDFVREFIVNKSSKSILRDVLFALMSDDLESLLNEGTEC